MELDLVRRELNMYDEAIKNLITLRMSLIPIVADIKIKNDLPLFQGKREEEIYNKIEIFAKENGVSAQLVKDIYKLIIANALQIEESIVDDQKNSIINKEIKDFEIVELENEFKKLDSILSKDIPNILEKIKNTMNSDNLKLIEKGTLYYNKKINL